MILSHRTIISISGEDRFSFLQSLITNHIGADSENTVYAHMLSPQGKFLFDMFIHSQEDRLLLDVYAETKEQLIKKLNMYKLRADVTIADETDNFLSKFGGKPDPRNANLGRDIIVRKKSFTEAGDNYTKARIENNIPEGHTDIISGEDFPLYFNLEEINGVSFTKGCYVGQEVTARMKHKTELKYKVQTIDINNHDVRIKRLLSQFEDKALALVHV